MSRCVKQGFEHAYSLCLETVPREADRNHRVVVRPDRAVMIRQRVIPRLALGKCSDTPTAETIPTHEVAGHAARPLRRYYAREQRMPRIRGTHPTGPFLTIERQDIRSHLLIPELSLESNAQFFGVGRQPEGQLRVP